MNPCPMEKSMKSTRRRKSLTPRCTSSLKQLALRHLPIPVSTALEFWSFSVFEK